jgi:hypothetical protein
MRNVRFIARRENRCIPFSHSRGQVKRDACQCFRDFCQDADGKLIVILRNLPEEFLAAPSMHDAWKLFTTTCILHGGM